MRHKEAVPVGELVEDEQLLAELQKAVDDANTPVSQAQWILPRGFAREVPPASGCRPRTSPRTAAI